MRVIILTFPICVTLLIRKNATQLGCWLYKDREQFFPLRFYGVKRNPKTERFGHMTKYQKPMCVESASGLYRIILRIFQLVKVNILLCPLFLGIAEPFQEKFIANSYMLIFRALSFGIYLTFNENK